jgi:hypothetical protein
MRRVPGFPGLYREDVGKEDTRFRIVIQRKNETTQEYFYFGAKRSEADARAAAINRWKEIRESKPVMSRLEFAQVERRKSRTGMVGVRPTRKIVKGHEYFFCEGWWSDRRRNRRVRGFSVQKYGEAEAKRLAIKARRDGLAEVGDA